MTASLIPQLRGTSRDQRRQPPATGFPKQFHQVADAQTPEILKLLVPKIEQDGPITVSAPTSPELKRFVDQLVKRTEKIKSGKVDPSDDRMLKITTAGSKAALDLRLVLPHSGTQ